MRLKLLTGDIIKHQGKRMKLNVSGVDVDSEFAPNPLMLNAHKQTNEDVYGRWINLQRDFNEITAETEFDESDPTATKIKSKVENGFIKGVSAGLKIEKYHFEEDLLVIDSSILYEASLTPLPANRNTLNLTYKNKEFKMNDKKESQELILTLSEDNSEPIQLVEAVEPTEPVITLNYQELYDKLELSFNELTLNLNEKDSIILNLTEKVEEFDRLVKQLTEEKANKEKAEYIKLSISNGLFNENQEATLLKLSMDILQELAGNATSVKRPAVSLSQLAKVELSGERDNWTFADWAKNDYVGLNLMKEQSPESYNDLYNKYYKKQKNN